jgi:hypothetical protein
MNIDPVPLPAGRAARLTMPIWRLQGRNQARAGFSLNEA